MAEAVPLLDALHALREPPPPSSVMPVLVMALAGILLAGAAAVVFAAVQARRRRVRSAAAAALARTRPLPPAERLAAQAALLRRLVRTVAGEEGARRQGADWLAQLDRLFSTVFFSQGEGRRFGPALYQAGASPDDPPQDTRRTALDQSAVDALDQALAGFIATVRR